MPQEKTDATGTTLLAKSYEDAVAATAAKKASPLGGQKPDTPTGTVHLNPALTPAPFRREFPERQPVPVVNEPGLLGSPPSLADLNRSYQRDQMGGTHPLDDVKVMSNKAQQATITDAAQARQDKIEKDLAESKEAAMNAADEVAAKDEAPEPKPATKPPAPPAPKQGVTGSEK